MPYGHSCPLPGLAPATDVLIDRTEVSEYSFHKERPVRARLRSAEEDVKANSGKYSSIYELRNPNKFGHLGYRWPLKEGS